jgi:hypothetical protein
MNRYTSIWLLGSALLTPAIADAAPQGHASNDSQPRHEGDAATPTAGPAMQPPTDTTTRDVTPTGPVEANRTAAEPVTTSNGTPGKDPTQASYTVKTGDAATTATDATSDSDSDEGEATTKAVDGDSADNKKTLGRFRFLLQLRYRQTYADSAALSTQISLAHEQRATLQEQDGYDIQRAFLRYTARPSEYVEGKLLVDFAELRHGNAKQAFKLAYLLLHPTKRLEFDVGLLKRTYSLLELLPIADHELADLGPTDNFIKDQGYGGRDIGAVVRYQPLPTRRWMTASLGAFRGDIEEGYDARPLKLVTARIESLPIKQIRIGVNAAYRPYNNVEMQRLTDETTGGKYYKEVTTLNSGKAVGADASLLLKRLQIRAETLYGDRTEPNRAGDDQFLAAWIVVAPNFKVGEVKFVPAVKVERLDLAPTQSGGCRTVITGVFGVVPLKGLRILTDITRTIVDPGLTALSRVPFTSSKNAVYAVEPSSTTGTIQLQYQF